MTDEQLRKMNDWIVEIEIRLIYLRKLIKTEREERKQNGER